MSSQLRLIGLVLFITTLFLAMAAAATKTTHIRFKKSSPVNANQSSGHARETLGSVEQASPLPAPSQALEFVAVPVIYPLLIAGVVGLLMWFVPAPRREIKSARKRTRRSRRR